MQAKAIAAIAAALLICMLPVASQALTAYSQDFEGLALPSVGGLLGDGWLVYGNVFTPTGIWIYGYGSFPAPNTGAAFCAVAAGEGGMEQGAQQLTVFSDYENGDHAVNVIESNVFHEQTIVADDVGSTWIFEFQAKLGNLAGISTAKAFIKTLNPAAGWAQTNFITADMTAIPVTWSGYSVSITIDAGLVGQRLQFGFTNTATHFESSGIFYDNVNFRLDTSTGVPGNVAVLGAIAESELPESVQSLHPDRLRRRPVGPGRDLRHRRRRPQDRHPAAWEPRGRRASRDLERTNRRRSDRPRGPVPVAC